MSNAPHQGIRIMPLALVLLAGLLAACTTRLDFSRAAPFQSPIRVDEAVLISFPQTIAKREYKVKIGKLWDTQVFAVPIMDAYKNEVSARMKSVFRGGVTVITDTALAQIIQADPESGVSNEPAARDLEAILADLTETEQLRRRELSKEDVEDAKTKRSSRRQEELTQEALRASQLEMMEQRDYGYLLDFQDAQLGMIDKRFVVSYRVRLVDWRTNNELLNKRYTARSRVLDARRNMKTNEKLLTDLVKEAFSGAMNQMMNDMTEVSGLR